LPLAAEEVADRLPPMLEIPARGYGTPLACYC
jgi:hypothetical protein